MRMDTIGQNRQSNIRLVGSSMSLLGFSNLVELEIYIKKKKQNRKV